MMPTPAPLAELQMPIVEALINYWLEIDYDAAVAYLQQMLDQPTQH